MLPGRRHVGVDHGREDHVEIWALRDLPILGVVVGALDVINARADGHRAAMQDRVVTFAFEWQRGEVGQFAQGDVDLARRAACTEVLDRRDKFIGEMFRLDELQEGALRVCSRHHDFGLELIAVLECDSNSASILDDDLLHACVDSDLHPERFRRVQDRAADSARAVLGKAPGAERAVNFAHIVMEQHIRRPRRARTQERADDPAGGFCTFQRVGLEPLFEQIRGRLRGELGNRVQFFFLRARRILTDFEQAEHVAQDQGSWVRRDQVDDWLDGFRGARHDACIFIVGFRILGRVTIDLAARQVVVVPRGEIISVFHWREGAWQAAGF